MIAVSVVLSGLSLLHPFIERHMFTDDHAQPMNGGQPAFLTYFTVLTITLALMALGFLYLPQMSSPAAGFSGAALVLPMLAMVFMSAGVSNATVAPPLVLRHTVGARDYSKLLSLGLSFYYIGSALGAPLWGTIQTLTGTYNPGLYAAPVVLALIVIFSLLAGRSAPKNWTNKTPAKDVAPAD